MYKIMFVGDVSLGEHFFSFGHGPKSLIDSGEYLFDKVQQLFSSADLVMANLEGSLSEINLNKNDPFSCVFRGNKNATSQLVRAGINIVSIANNHSMDHGEECFDDTVRMLEECGIEISGLHYDPIKYLKLGDTRIAFISASDIEKNNGERILKFEKENLFKLVKLAKSRSNFVILNLHWGVEAKNRCEDWQIDIAKDLIEGGVDAIIGHHPHVVYEFQRINSSVVAYSLGDFIFDLPWDERLLKSVILELNLENDRIGKVVVWPIMLDNRGIPSAIGDPIELLKNNLLDVYKHNEPIESEIKRKLIFYLKNICRGNTYLKMFFLLLKIKRNLFRI